MPGLPGSTYPVNDPTTTCEECDKAAVVIIQGETDSFGAEYHPLCEEHRKPYDAEAEEVMTGCCDWCKKGPLTLHYKRDSDEGDSGPVYRVCQPCILKQMRDDAEELAWMHRNDEPECGDMEDVDDRYDDE